jgi:hypothetical protein
MCPSIQKNTKSGTLVILEDEYVVSKGFFDRCLKLYEQDIKQKIEKGQIQKESKEEEEEEDRGRGKGKGGKKGRGKEEVKKKDTKRDQSVRHISALSCTLNTLSVQPSATRECCV